MADNLKRLLVDDNPMVLNRGGNFEINLESKTDQERPS